MSRRNSYHIPWSKTDADIILIKNQSSGEFRYALTGNIKYKEDWVQGFNSTGYCSGNYYGGREICYDGDNLMPYKQGMKEMCDMTKIEGDAVAYGINQFIFHNGQHKKLPFALAVHWYQRDMDKVNKFWKGSDRSGWTTDYVKCGSCDGKGGGCNSCHGQKFITKQQQIRSEERAKAQQAERELIERREAAVREEQRRKFEAEQKEEKRQKFEAEQREQQRQKFEAEQKEQQRQKFEAEVILFLKMHLFFNAPEIKCTVCNGTGKEGEQICSDLMCDGNGFLVEISGMPRPCPVDLYKLDDYKKYLKMDVVSKLCKKNINVGWIPFEQREQQRAKQHTVVYASGAIVRKTEDLSSEFVANLAVGTIVLVEEIKGRRCLVSSQTNEVMLGWISLFTANQVPVVRKTDDIPPQNEVCCVVL